MIKNGGYIPERVNIAPGLRDGDSDRELEEFLKYNGIWNARIEMHDPARISVIEIGKLRGPI